MHVSVHACVGGGGMHACVGGGMHACARPRACMHVCFHLSTGAEKEREKERGEGGGGRR
jgi:hypothetical protein